MPARAKRDPHSLLAHAVELDCTPLRSRNRRLVKEPLTAEDWAEVHRAYLSFLTHVRLVVATARARAGTPVPGDR